MIAVCLTLIACSSVLIASFFYDNYILYFEHNSQTGSHQTDRSKYAGSSVPILQPTNTTNPDSSKPNIITTGLNTTDERVIPPYRLHISGRLNNTGGGTAYNAYLHIIAYNKEGLAVDSNYEFGGMTGHITLGLDFKLNYTGSQIDNCTITPFYYGHLQISTQNPVVP